MKRKYLIMSIVASLLISMTACQKDLEKTKNVSISQEDLEMAKKITSFITRMNTIASASEYNLKSGGALIEIEEAIWNVEAAANYTFADIPEQFGNTKIDTLVFTIPVENGFCSEKDLSALYQSVIVAIQDYLSTLDEYQLIGVDVNIGEENAGDINVYIINAKKTAESCDFEPENLWRNWWRPGLGKGKCSDDPQYYGRDAATEIQKKANACNIKEENVFYSSITTKNFSGLNLLNPNYNPQVDGYYKEYLLYRDSVDVNSIANACLPPGRLNFHLSNIRHYANNVWKPEGKNILSYNRIKKV